MAYCKVCLHVFMLFNNRLVVAFEKYSTQESLILIDSLNNITAVEHTIGHININKIRALIGLTKLFNKAVWI